MMYVMIVDALCDDVFAVCGVLCDDVFAVFGVVFDVFFDELKIPKPSFHLHVGSGKHGEQTGQMLQSIENSLCISVQSTIYVQILVRLTARVYTTNICRQYI